MRWRTPRAIVAAWMASPGHRANILDARFRDTGIGVSPHPPASLADGQAGAIYTQDFGVIIGCLDAARTRCSGLYNLRSPDHHQKRAEQWEYSTGSLRSSPARHAGSVAPPRSCSSEQGAQVLINDLDGDVAEQAASEIKGETAVFAGDLTKPGAADELVQKAIDSFGKIDIIVNNAGYTLDAPVHKMTDEHFQAMLDIHTIVPFRVIRAAAPHLREPAKKEREEGKEVFRKIVNVSSTSGTFGNAGQANYSSGKAGVVGLTKTVAKEWGQFKVNVNAVAFGFIDTRLTQAKVDENTMEKDGEKIQLGIPEQMRQMASDDDPARPPRHPRGGRRRRLLPLLPVVELRPRPDPPRHRRAVRRDDRLSRRGRAFRCAAQRAACLPRPPARPYCPVHATAQRRGTHSRHRGANRAPAADPAGSPRSRRRPARPDRRQRGHLLDGESSRRRARSRRIR